MTELNTATTLVLFSEEFFFHVLAFCDEVTRARCILLSSFHHKTLTSEAAFKWRVHRLHVENGIYHPPVMCLPHALKAKHATWKSIFLKNWQRRNMWQDEEALTHSTDENKFHIKVIARFKPRPNEHSTGKKKGGDTTTRVAADERKIALPLHQRLALIQTNRKLQSRGDAFKVLMSQGGWFGQANEEEKDGGSGDDDCKVNQPPPPLSGGVQHIDVKNGSVVVVDRIKGLREFEFDRVLSDKCNQSDTYVTTAMPLITEFINGSSATCLVYGQTSSGKTHTMIGHKTDIDKSIITSGSYNNFENYSNIVWGESTSQNQKNGISGGVGLTPSSSLLPESWGVIPRACYEIFQAIDFREKNRKINLNISHQLSVSYVEIFGNDVIDLLRNGEACGHSKVSAQRYVLDGSSEIPVNSFDDALSLLNEGEKQKRLASTAMNDQSSRAHSVFILTLRQRQMQKFQSSSFSGDNGSSRGSPNKSYTSRLFLADLGGSEKLKKSQPYYYYQTTTGEVEDEGLPASICTSPESVNNDDHHVNGTTRGSGNNHVNRRNEDGQNVEERVKEAVNINRGLLALKQCVESLQKKQQRKKGRGHHHIHVPYSDSKLTMMLSTGLGGDSRTTVIVCGAQDEYNVNETIASMKFGQVCRGIHNTVGTHHASTRNNVNNMVRDLLTKIDNDIAECEENIRKYERWEVKNVEKYGDNGKLIDVRQTTVIVGAEEYREELNYLLRKKMELTGDKL